MSWLRRAAELVHRQVWRRIPRRLRRAALHRTAYVLAPRPTAGARPTRPVFVAGYFRTASGLGESARLCLDALQRLGIDAHGMDISAAHMQPADLPRDDAHDHRSHRGPGTVILHVNAPLVPLALMQLGRPFMRQKHIVGAWAWELERIPPDWVHGIGLVHQAWAPSRFTAEAIARSAPDLAVCVVAHPLAVGAGAAATAPASGSRFRVLLIFNAASSFARKNPRAGIAAFRRAFSDDPGVELIVKSSNLGSFPDGRAMLTAAIGDAPNIRHVADVLAPGALQALYHGADAVLSLHRSEGFGLVPAEAMLRGLPVVATGWSGNADFLDAQNGCPVRHTLVPARDPQHIYDFPGLMWAEPDIDHAAELLRRLRDDPGWRAYIGKRAAQDAARLFSLDAFRAAISGSLALPPPD
jgi:glycosyltransferase involved in cell wall biosynthesis